MGYPEIDGGPLKERNSMVGLYLAVIP